MLEKPLPHVAGGHTNDRVIRGVVRGGSFEQGNADAALPQVHRIAVERLFDDVDQERLAARAPLESRAFYDLIQVAKNFGFVFSGFANLGDSRRMRNTVEFPRHL